MGSSTLEPFRVFPPRLEKPGPACPLGTTFTLEAPAAKFAAQTMEPFPAMSAAESKHAVKVLRVRIAFPSMSSV